MVTFNFAFTEYSDVQEEKVAKNKGVIFAKIFNIFNI